MLTVSEAADTLRRAADEQRRAAASADWRSWRLADLLIQRCGDVLLASGPEGIDALRSLAARKPAHVKVSAARFLLWKDERSAKAVLREARSKSQLTGFMADEVLHMWEEGRLPTPTSLARPRVSRS